MNILVKTIKITYEIDINCESDKSAVKFNTKIYFNR